jgi:hypothetical protein
VSGTLSYVFCLVSSGRTPAMRGVGKGMPGGTRLRAVEAGERLWAIVQDVTEADYGEVALARGLQDLAWVGARAIAHEHLIERFIRADALLPMQLFTLFTSDARLVEFVDRDRVRIARVLKRVAGKVEWGLRLTWDEQAARAKVERKHAGARRQSAESGSSSAGSAYLSKKRDLLNVNRAQLAEVRTEAGRIYSAIARSAAAAVRRTAMERAAPGSRLLLDAAFLVAAAKVTSFRTAVRTHTSELRGAGVAVALTGPWPAYNFIS